MSEKSDDPAKRTDEEWRKQLSPEAIFVPGYYTEGGNIAIQARQLGIKAPLIGGAGWSVTIGSPFRDGLHALTATVSVDGLTSAASAPVAVAVVTGPPEVAIAGVTPDDGLLPGDRVVTTGAVTVEGTATPGCKLDLFEDYRE